MKTLEFKPVTKFGKVELMKKASTDLVELGESPFEGTVSGRIKPAEGENKEKKAIKIEADGFNKVFYSSAGMLAAAYEGTQAPTGFVPAMTEKKGEWTLDGGKGEYQLVNGALYKAE
jgi:hypothetical protein